jgi:hypothetical protein
MAIRPTREGEYEGREKRTGFVIPVYWRKLTDEKKPGWYYWKGVLGPFNLWQAADLDMTAWRGLAENPNKDQKNG